MKNIKSIKNGSVATVMLVTFSLTSLASKAETRKAYQQALPKLINELTSQSPVNDCPVVLHNKSALSALFLAEEARQQASRSNAAIFPEYGSRTYKQDMASLVEWRDAITFKDPAIDNTQVASSSIFREFGQPDASDPNQLVGGIAGMLEQMWDIIKNNGRTPGMWIFPQREVFIEELNQNTQSGNSHQIHSSRLYVPGMTWDESQPIEIDMSILVPVSGHTGFANAQRYAKSNKVNVWMERPDGTRQDIASSVLTKGFISIFESRLQISGVGPNNVHTLYFYPEGSGGVNGASYLRTWHFYVDNDQAAAGQ